VTGPGFTQSAVEQAALAWLNHPDHALLLGPEIAPGTIFAKFISGELRVRTPNDFSRTVHNGCV